MLSRSNRRSGYRRGSPQPSRRGLITWVVAALAIVASGAVVACSERVTAPDLFSTVAPARELATLGPLTVANVGAYHNAFLDFSFPRVKKAVGNGADHKQACRVIAQAMREFILAYRLDADPRHVGDDIAGARCPAASRNGPVFSLGTDDTPSPEFDAVTFEMVSAVESGLSAAELSPLFEEKVAYARANLDPAEAEVIAAAASVGLSSVEYWTTNYEPQMEQLLAAINQETYNRIPLRASANVIPNAALLIPEAPRFGWWDGAVRVGAADLKGAIHGGISGFRGTWQSAAIGAAIEGGGKSAGALIKELLK